MHFFMYFNTAECVVALVLASNAGFPYLSIVRLTLLHSERPRLYVILAFLSAIGLSFTSGFLVLRNDCTVQNIRNTVNYM